MPHNMHATYLAEMGAFAEGTLPEATVALPALPFALATHWSQIGSKETQAAGSLEEILEEDSSGFPDCKRVMTQSASFLLLQCI